MKKLLCLLFIGGAFVVFTSCNKSGNCTCKESKTGVSEEVTKEELGGLTCKEFEKLLNEVSMDLLKWKCK